MHRQFLWFILYVLWAGTSLGQDLTAPQDYKALT